MPEEKTFKCANCGFLTAELLPGMEHGGYPEIPAHVRSSGERRPTDGFPLKPRCFRGAIAIGADWKSDLYGVGQEPRGDEAKRVYLHVIGEIRVCDKFLEYQPGFTPREHMESLEEVRDAAKRNLRERADRLRTEEADRIRWEAERDHREEELRVAKRNSTRTFIASIVIALVGAGGGIWVANINATATVEAALKKLDSQTAAEPAPLKTPSTKP